MKNQFKKCMSLFLAVLMLMTCWVWVAPTKAEAAYEQTYNLTINFDVGTKPRNGGHIKVWFYKFKDNGTGVDLNTSTEEIYIGSLKNECTCGSCAGSFDSNTSHSITKPLKGWPYKIEITVANYTWGTEDIILKSAVIGDRNILGNADQFTIEDNETKRWEINPTTGEQSGDWGSATADWPLPEIRTVEATPEIVTLTANIFGGAAVSEEVGFVAYDNYGTQWARMPAGSIALANSKGSTAGINSSNISATTPTLGNPKTTITVKPEIQLLNPNAEAATYYATATFAEASCRVPVMVEMPRYTQSFNENGGTLDKNDAAPITDLVYGQPIGYVPVLGAKAGKQLVGFVFDGNSDTVKYDSQTLIDPSASTTDDIWLSAKTKVDTWGDHTWYAVWALKDINATFKMPDGQTIATVRGKAGNYLTSAEEGREMYGSTAALNEAIKANCTNSTIGFNYDNEPVWNVNGTAYDFVGWRIIEAKDADGKVIGLSGDDSTVLQGDTVFEAVYEMADQKTYSIRFYRENGNVLNERFDYKYKEAIAFPQTQTHAADSTYTYRQVGWAPYVGPFVYFVDSEGKDENGAVISYVSLNTDDFVVRGDAAYVPVFERTYIDYNTIVKYKANNGKAAATDQTVNSVLHWNDKIEIPVDEIPAEYTAGGTRYRLKAWSVKANGSKIGEFQTKLDDETGKYYIDGANVQGTMLVEAVYENLGAATYTISFRDRHGNLVPGFETEQVAHGNTVVQPVAGKDIPETDADNDYYYEFKGWATTPDGTARKNIGTAVLDATYYAIYDSKQFVDITYYNEGEEILKLNGNGKDAEGNETNAPIIEGQKIPAFSLEEPTKAEDVIGKYTFAGWKDSDGNDVVPGTTVATKDLQLNAQYDVEYTDYTVVFKNADGTVVSEEVLHYGDPVTVPEVSMEADETYTYDFRQWSPSVSTVCVGNAEYTAVYNLKYNYYTVTWRNGNGTALNTAKYIYNETIITPPAQPTPREIKQDGAVIGYWIIDQVLQAPDNYTWVIDKWVRFDGKGGAVAIDGTSIPDFIDGTTGAINSAYTKEVTEGGLTYKVVDESKVKIYSREDKATHDGFYYPTFKLQANAYTVTFYDEAGETQLGKWTVPYGTLLNSLDVQKPVKPAGVENIGGEDVEVHYNFDAWVDENGNEVSTVEKDVTVKATYVAEAHNYQMSMETLITKPTCTELGRAVYSCSCGRSYEGDVPVIPDDQAPDGKITVDQMSWTRNQFAAGSVDYATPYDVCPTDNFVVTTKDLGTWSRPFNLLEPFTTSRVDKIEYYIATAETDVEDITDWTVRYTYAAAYEEACNNFRISNSALTEAEVETLAKAYMNTAEANATIPLKNLNLTDGEEYIIYVKLTDRVGNTSYLSTGKLSYDETKPEIAIEGEDGKGSTYCTEATIVWDATDDTIASVTLNGVEIKDAVTAEAGKYPVNVAGIHQAVITDVAGNKSSENFVVNGTHKYENKIIPATCSETGKSYAECSFCGDIINERTLAATGHEFKSYISIAPTCVDDGYLLYTCSNGCGTTRTYYPGNTTVPETEKELLESLKATGEHTYPTQNVLDEDGNPVPVEGKEGEYVQEEAWVIDSAPTCVEYGLKHRDCTVCGERQTVEIDKDRENGHKYYRAKVAQEATCTEEGYKSQTCKYCGYVKLKAEIIPAKGHTAGDYRIIKEAACDQKGEKILTCAVCKIDLGEMGEDGSFDITKTVEIPALVHAYVAVGDVYKQDGKNYQLYVCSLCGKEDPREVEVEILPEYTYTFYNGETEIISITKKKGETISNADVTDPSKAEDDVYRYSFTGWASVDAEGNTTAYDFPIIAEADTDLYAQFKSTYKNYTITYIKDDGKTQFKKVGYLHFGETYDLVEAPVKAADKYNTYEFDGWVNRGKVYEGTITIEGNITLTAQYTATPRVYKVTFAYDANNIIGTVNVAAGLDATDYYMFDEPTKAPDSKYHYTFKDWDNSSVAEVYSDIYTTPNFTPASHNFTITEEVSPADCDNAQVVKKICSDCGYFYETEGDPAIKHEWTDVTDENGTHQECKFCDKVNDEQTYTVKFWIQLGTEKAYKTYSYNLPGSTLAAAPAEPSKAQTKQVTFKFSHWVIDGDATGTKYTSADIVKYAIYKNVDFVAVFTEEAREYTVTFALDAYNILDTVVVKAGEEAVYTGETPEKAPDSKYHYTFNNTWDNASLGEVYSDIYTRPNFDKAEHTFSEKEFKPATCTENAEMTKYCACGYSYNYRAAGTATGHDWDTPYIDETTGESIQKCKNCNEFTSNTQNYTVRFWKDAADQRAYRSSSFNKWGTLAIAPVAPAKKSTDSAKYTFSHWSLKGDDESAEVDFSTYLIKADTDFVAVYTSEPLTYTVTYYQDGGIILYTDKVTAGSASVYVGATPTQAADSKYHYTFSKWSNASLGEVYSDIYTKPVFTPVEHEFTEGETVTGATCDNDAVVKMVCDCGYSYEVKKAGTATGHSWSEPYLKDGKYYKKCINPNCDTADGLVIEDTETTFAVTFYKDEEAKEVYKHYSFNVIGKPVSAIPADPSKDATDYKVYTFSHWYVKGDKDKKAVDLSTYLITEETEFVPVFTEETKTYTVTFKSGSTVLLEKEVVAGGTVSYDGATPTQAFNDTVHYTFSGWSEEAKDVTSDMTILAKFTSARHENNIVSKIEATCTKGSTVTYGCSCGWSLTDENADAPKGHGNWTVVEKVPATPEADGYIKYRCGNSFCDIAGGATKTEVLKWQSGETVDPAAKVTITVIATFKGQTVNGAKVELFDMNGNRVGDAVFTGSSGSVSFTVDKGSYRVLVSGVAAAQTWDSEANAAGGSITVNADLAPLGCACACHRNSIWGVIFRFFHQIIAWLTGGFKCCGCGHAFEIF